MVLGIKPRASCILTPTVSLAHRFLFQRHFTDCRDSVNLTGSGACEVSGEAQKFRLQLVLWSLSLDPSPQHPRWVAETRTYSGLPAQAWASATAPQLTLICLLLWECLAQGAPATLEHLLGNPWVTHHWNRQFDPCPRAQSQGLTSQGSLVPTPQSPGTQILPPLPGIPTTLFLFIVTGMSCVSSGTSGVSPLLLHGPS